MRAGASEDAALVADRSGTAGRRPAIYTARATRPPSWLRCDIDIRTLATASRRTRKKGGPGSDSFEPMAQAAGKRCSRKISFCEVVGEKSGGPAPRVFLIPSGLCRRRPKVPGSLTGSRYAAWSHRGTNRGVI